ncbi:hypothetical protein L345_18171, partial [Ophiophagus hannah]
MSQEPALSATLGQPATVSCNITGGYYFGTFSWYQQKEAENLAQRLLVISLFLHPPPKKNAFLTINNVQAKDEGDYYCGDARHSEEPQRGG